MRTEVGFESNHRVEKPGICRLDTEDTAVLKDAYPLRTEVRVESYALQGDACFHLA